ncbi:hypothetical protein [uncultured Bradyrhizobium sp.]|jgi:hypothetical protein|uniref:hypothetical protein n=1 Tax=uncultured Bradyrhizobium sp. TaxID=199684 RepID=UPI00262261EB|nr:hypothetical protein [uncultured Bradyrhizobium sp.]
MDNGTLISLTSAIVAVAAAGISIWQATAARRQAAAAHGELDPTFHVVKASNLGMPPWRFDFVANNFNRRAIELLEVGIQIPNCVVYREHEQSREVIRSIIQGARQDGDIALFDFTRSVGFTLPGVAPNSADPGNPLCLWPKRERAGAPDRHDRDLNAVDLCRRRQEAYQEI